MTDIDIQKLYDATLRKEGIKELTQIQSVKFRRACNLVFLGNPTNNFPEHIICAHIYLRSILSFPDLTLPTEEIFNYHDSDID